MFFQPKTQEIKSKFLSLKQRPIDISIKISLMEGLLHQIKELALTSHNIQVYSSVSSDKNIEFSQTTCTQTFNPKSGILPTETREQFELKIIQQQRTKVQLYDQIELHEDDLYQLQKVIKSKKQYEENLDKRIFELQYLIQKNSKDQPIEQKGQKKPISARIKQFFM